MFRSLVVIFVFGLLTLFPAWEAITRCLPDAPLDEKRLHVPAPQWRASPSLKAYLTGWQSWFNDRYAGRNLLIRIKTQLDYSLFSYSDKVYIGPDGWLFYRSMLDGEEPGLESYQSSDVDLMVRRLSVLRIWLAERGITLVIIDNPLKDYFYPEMVPASAPRSPVPSRAAEIQRRLRGQTGAVVVDTAGILNRIKPERPIFHHTDFHWNDPAAFAVAQDTVDRMAQSLGKPALGWYFKLAIETRRYSGGEASFMPLLRPVEEQGLFVRQTWKNADADYTFKQGPFEFVQRLRAPHRPVLPTAVVLGDSFYDGMERSGFAQHFSSVYRARTYGASLQDVLTHLPPDTRFVVLEFIDVAVGAFTVPLDFTALDRAFPKPPGTTGQREK